MLNLLRSLFDSAQFVPHGVCLLWRPDLIILHGGSDFLIAAAYLTIPFVILRAMRRRPDLVDARVGRMFAAFITACALSHLSALATLWVPAYGIQGFVKLLTAIVSAYTAFQLVRLLPVFLQMPSREEMIRKDAELLLRQREMEAARASQEKMSEFAYIASHDLKAPVRGILNQARFLKEDHGTALPDEARTRIDRIAELCEQVEGLISTLLRYAKLGQSQAHERVDVTRVVTDIADSVREYVDERGARIVTDPDLPAVEADPAEVEIVFRNLILNGLKYNVSDHPEVRIGYRDTAIVNGRQLRQVYAVRDNGVGIDPDLRGAVFRMFKRLHHDEAFGAGTGAGLAFVKKVVEAGGGAVDVESTPGEGSVFYVSFARQADAAAAANTGPERPDNGLPGTAQPA